MQNTKFEIYKDSERCRVKRKAKDDYKMEEKSKKPSLTERVIITQPDNCLKDNSKIVTTAIISYDDCKLDARQITSEISDAAPLEEGVLKIEKMPQILTERFMNDRTFRSSLQVFGHDYQTSIGNYLKQLELSYPRCKPNFMSKQDDINWDNRGVLIDWLCVVAQEYALSNDTFHATVDYIDRYLSKYRVCKSKFQLVGATALLIAGKVEDIYPVPAKTLSELTEDTYSTSDILKMERMILKCLEYRLQPPTMHAFIKLFCMKSDLDDKTMNLALYISELVLLERKNYLQHLPSELAAAAIALARHTQDKTCWTSKLKESSGYSLKELSPVVHKQNTTLKVTPMKDNPAIPNKYSSPVYNKVALMKPKVLRMFDFDEEE